jgi:pimeloyl-ACP methyl ester carboxylesterase
MADLIVDGVRFNVVRLGPAADAPRARPPVVFVHGLIIDNLSSFYYTLAPVVASDADVLCYDLRGHGRSERPLSGYRLEDAVADLCGILDAAGFAEPVQLVGNSFGGTIALRTALWAPERVAAMALVEANPGFDGWADDMVEDLEDLVEGFDGPGMRDYIASNAPRKTRSMVDCCEELVAKSSLPADFRLSTPTTPADLHAIRCPSLLLYGDCSDILDRGFALADSLPRSELRIIENCTHSLLMEAPEIVAGHVVPWLADPAHHVAPAERGRSS